MSDEITFLPETHDAQAGGHPWKVLVVDDDSEIHHVTRIVLDSLVFHGRAVVLLTASSAAEARDMLRRHPDVAVLFLDVVMETEDAGLALVPYLREELGLRAMRIVLRTGQPGQAPERDVILRYDIDDYRAKTEMTAQKLLTSTVAGLRAFEALEALERHRAGLEQQVVTGDRDLKVSEARFQALLDALPEGVVVVDADGRVRTFSPSAERIFGRHGDDVLGHAVDALIPAFGNAPEDGTAALGRDVNGMRGDGSIVRLDLSVNRVTIAGESLQVAVVRDATERHRAEQYLRHARDEAERAARAKSEFLAVMSHEVRTPLNGILGMAQLMLDSGLSPVHRDQAETIRQSGQSLLAVLNDVLDLSKLEAGRLDLEENAFDPVTLVRDVADLMMPRVQEKGLHLRLTVPEVGAVGLILGDGGRLRQVLLNLLSNAVKFTETGTITLATEVLDAGSDPVLAFIVSDTGIGMEETAIKALFQPFTQADSSISRRFGGTGLGLAICKRLVDLMGGTISTSSRPGEGTRFSVEVPVRRPKAGAAAAEGNDAAVLDGVALEGLMEALGGDGVADLLRLFLGDATRLLGRVRRAAAAGNSLAMVAAAEDIAASAGHFGFTALRDAARDVVDRAARLPAGRLPALAESLAPHIDGATRAVAARDRAAAAGVSGSGRG